MCVHACIWASVFLREKRGYQNDSIVRKIRVQRNNQSSGAGFQLAFLWHHPDWWPFWASVSHSACITLALPQWDGVVKPGYRLSFPITPQEVSKYPGVISGKVEIPRGKCIESTHTFSFLSLLLDVPIQAQCLGSCSQHHHRLSEMVLIW